MDGCRRTHVTHTVYVYGKPGTGADTDRRDCVWAICWVMGAAEIVVSAADFSPFVIQIGDAVSPASLVKGLLGGFYSATSGCWWCLVFRFCGWDD